MVKTTKKRMVQVWLLCSDKEGEKTPEHKRVMCHSDTIKLPNHLTKHVIHKKIEDKNGKWPAVYSLDESTEDALGRWIDKRFDETPFKFVPYEQLA